MSGGGKHKMPEMKEGGVNVTPLIDVVMCLIVFFMLVAKIGVATGASKPMMLPDTIVGTKLELLGDNIVLNIEDPTVEKDPQTKQTVYDEKGKARRKPSRDPNVQPIVSLLVSDDPTASKAEKDRGGYKVIPTRRVIDGREVSPLKEVLTAWVNLMTAENEKRKTRKEKPKEFSVTIRCERAVPFYLVQQVLTDLNAAGVKNVNYAAIGKSDK
ncbi:MAG TPA: biopolymer transporter ExbD [Humisphaera sp.]